VYCVHNLEIFDSVYQTTLAAERQPERRKQREPSIIWLIGCNAGPRPPVTRTRAIAYSPSRAAGRARARGPEDKIKRPRADLENPDAPGCDDEVPVHAVGNRSNRARLPSPLLSWNSSYRHSADRSNGRHDHGATAGAGD
jgi:hypothetical protein